MIDPVYIGRSGLRAQQQMVETISNNIANLNATAFKKEVAQLSPVRAVADRFADSLKPAAAQAGQVLGVQVTGVQRDMSQGQLQTTGRPLDLAIQGNGFFVLQRPDGSEAYARAGEFTVSEDGFMVDRNGNRLQPDIQIDGDASNLVVDRSGLVSVTQTDGSSLALGQLQIARFANPDNLTLDGTGVYLAGSQSGKAVDVKPGEEQAGLVMQGYLESSNVSLVDEFTSLVMAQRAYEASAKVVQTAGELFDAANGLLRA